MNLFGIPTIAARETAESTESMAPSREAYAKASKSYGILVQRDDFLNSEKFPR